MNDSPAPGDEVEICRRATIVDVDRDEIGEPRFTVRLPNGSIETVPGYLVRSPDKERQRLERQRAVLDQSLLDTVMERDRLQRLLADIYSALYPVSAESGQVVEHTELPAHVTSLRAIRDRLQRAIETALSLGETTAMYRGKDPYPEWWVTLDRALDPRWLDEREVTDG